MKKQYFIQLILATVILMTSSCKKFVEIGPPESELIDKTVFEDAGLATSAMTAAYSKLVDNNVTYELPLQTGLYSDELKNYSSNIYQFIPFYTNSLSGGGDTYIPYWSRFYEYVYQANAVLEGCKNAKTLADNVKNQLIGEALFFRSFCYFYLVNLYGDVPLIKSTDYKVNAQLARSDAQEVYEQIIVDLIEAASLLNERYVDKTSVLETIDRVRPNKYAAAALLARVYLFTGKFAESELAATSVISQSELYDTVPLNEAFLKNNKEAIWQLPPSDNLTWFNTAEGRDFILDARPSTCTLSDQLLAAFETNDNRKAAWTGVYVEDTETFSYPYKYKVKYSSDILEYSTVLRLAEQYLIRAEAYAQQGKVAESINDLNVIRTRAGLPPATVSSASDLLDAILRERQVELFTEWGHRWLDLKRSGTVDTVMDAIAPLKGSSWASFKILWPIPQTDINNNHQLQQTPGY